MNQKSTAEVRKLAVEQGDLAAQQELERRRKEYNQMHGDPFRSTFSSGGRHLGDVVI